MKIVMVSNFFNHHQKPLSDSLAKLAEEYWFVATSEVPEDRIRLGYSEIREDYVINVRTEEDKAFVNDKIEAADMVIIGSAPEEYIRSRLEQNRLTFRYSERPLKNRGELWKYPIRWVKWRKLNPVGKPLYLLCASAYTAGDFAKFGLFKNKAFRWGYFPEAKRYADVGALIEKKKPHSLLWVGRFLDWKHPEMAVDAAAALRDKGFDFTLEMIGIGEEAPKIREMIRERGLETQVCLSGSLPYREVRERMESAQIFLFTSNKHEGWGAVLNEAMNSACAAVVSDEIGSAPYLIEDGTNGLTFPSCDTKALTDRIEYLLTHDKERREIGAGAYRTIAGTWNAEVAAQRLITLSESLAAGQSADAIFIDGPCSRAEILT